jgi:hypothetical protein
MMSLQLWPDPRDGLDPSDAPWNWTELDSYADGATKNPPTADPGWKQWYFRYERPDGVKVKVSADREPQPDSGLILTRLHHSNGPNDQARNATIVTSTSRSTVL